MIMTTLTGCNEIMAVPSANGVEQQQTARKSGLHDQAVAKMRGSKSESKDE